MKRIILSVFTVVSFTSLFAQTPEDALRLAWNVQGGTARAQAIGGAMGSLGGDITATFVNPAGLGFYRTGDVVFTPSYGFGKTKATYIGRRTDSATNKFAIGTSGVVWGSNDNGKHRSSAISLAINQTADFKNNIIYRGSNNSSSYSQKFLDELRNGNVKDGNTAASSFPFGTSLAFNTYWIDTIGGGTNGNFQFQTRAPIGTGLLQQNTISTTGGITEFALGVGVNLNDKLLIGGSIGVPVMRYEKEAEFVEADATGNTTNKFDYAVYKQGLTTTGVGVNLKGGIIYKPQEFWRLGFAFHSPTLYSLTDKNTAQITTNTEGYKGSQTQRLEDVAGAASQLTYLQMTPLKLIGSVSYVLREIADVTKQRGFLTADVEYVAYPMLAYYATDTETSPADPETKAYFKSLNKTISNTYKGAFNFRAGGELKFTTFMVRAGVAYYGNPYKNIHDENGDKLNLSGGLGYRNKGFFIDATYVYSLSNDVDIAYRLQNGIYYNANLKNTAGKVFLTFGFKI